MLLQKYAHLPNGNSYRSDFGIENIVILDKCFFVFAAKNYICY